MNIIREELAEGTALLKIQVTPQDYQEAIDKNIEKYRKSASMPGFRKGKIPVSLVKKQYGKSFLADELNKIINDSLAGYISDNKLDLLGRPIPAKLETKGDFDNPSDFEFPYEIATVPEFKVALDGRTALTYNVVNVDDKLIDEQVEDLRRRYGKLVSAEKVGEKDLVLATLTELNDDESVKEDGVSNSSTISMEFLDHDKSKKALLSKKIGDTLIVNPFDISKDDDDTASMLGIKKEELANISEKFELKITEIKQMEMAEINQDLFDKLFGKDSIKSEAELRERVKDDLSKMFNENSDKLLMNDAYDHLMDKTELSLPADFMKRWILLNSDTSVSMEDIERDYVHYEKSMKWQLIQGKIFKDNNLQLQREEVMDYAKGLLTRQFAQYGMPITDDEMLTSYAERVLGDGKESKQIYDMIAEQKLIEYIKSTAKLNENKVTHQEFSKIAQEKHHDHDHYHDHEGHHHH